MWKNNSPAHPLSCKPQLSAALLLLISIILPSCTRTVQKTTETYDTIRVAHSVTDTLLKSKSTADTLYILSKDTVRVSDVIRDSVVVRDSVFVREKGDSVYVYKERWRERLVLAHDTLVRAKTDTVFRTKTDTVTVYRYVERNDSAYNSKTDKKKVVKQKRTSEWMKVLGLVIAIAVLAVWRKFRR